MSKCSTEANRLENQSQKEFDESTLKRQKLEQAIKQLEAARTHRIDKAALKDIEAHRNRRSLVIEASASERQSGERTAFRERCFVTAPASSSDPSNLPFG
jgi:hypothetical protein